MQPPPAVFRDSIQREVARYLEGGPAMKRKLMWRIFPESRESFRRLTVSLQRHTKGMAQNTPALSAALSTSAVSSASSPMGFSIAKGIPRRISSRAMSFISQCGAKANTKSGRSASSSARQSV